jgi:hypothetical protein
VGRKEGKTKAGRGRAGGPRCYIIFLVILALGAPLARGDERKPEPPAGGRIKAMRIDGYFDPQSNFLDATARLQFSQPAQDRRLWLAEGLQLNSVRSGSAAVTGVQRNSNQFLVQCPSFDELEMSYSGSLSPLPDPIEASWASPADAGAERLDDCHFLSYISDFYPHPLPDFAAMKVDLRLPAGWNCLGSGTLLSVSPAPDGNRFSFDNAEAKGMSLVCGRFRQIDLLPGALPLRLHAWPGFRLKDYFSKSEFARLLSFYVDRYGPLDSAELNVLFRRGHHFGGVSYNGLIVLGVDEKWGRTCAKARKMIEKRSPLAMSGAGTDLLAHEMAHQWWGGLVSWKSAADNWITEGMATYSMLLYARERLGERAWHRLRRKLQGWTKRYAGIGAPAEGARLKLAQTDLKAYQAVVYIKPALMMAELADRIGEGELFRRLRAFLVERRYSNVSTAEFLDMLAAGDTGLRARLEEWIGCRGVPKPLQN